MIFFKPYFGAKLTTMIGIIHGMYFLIAPGNQDLNESMFVSASPLSKLSKITFFKSKITRNLNQEKI